MDPDQDLNRMDEEEYDEEADSDFDGDIADNDDALSSSEDDDAAEGQKTHVQQKKFSRSTTAGHVAELDSGDEATIREREKSRRRSKRKNEDDGRNSDDQSDGWRAKTRAMRQVEKEHKKTQNLATLKTSTIDVDKLWEEMNRPGHSMPVRSEVSEVQDDGVPDIVMADTESHNKENLPTAQEDDTITIKRTFKFAGEVHVEEKTVPRSSAEARLWLAQQGSKPEPEVDGQIPAQRPLRKISRFDPNYNNLSAFKVKWTKPDAQGIPFSGPKLNVVEKSKMDWAVHVDAEGLKDELDIHAKAKEGYHSRMEFLNQVEQHKEEVARQARTNR